MMQAVFCVKIICRQTLVRAGRFGWRGSGKDEKPNYEKGVPSFGYR